MIVKFCDIVLFVMDGLVNGSDVFDVLIDVFNSFLEVVEIVV